MGVTKKPDAFARVRETLPVVLGKDGHGEP